MLKSLCIKTNNNRVINYLLDEFSNAKLNDLYISTSKFKLYNNFIIHYKGKELDTFYNITSNILSSLVINLYEETLLKPSNITDLLFAKYSINEIFKLSFLRETSLKSPQYK